MKAVSRRDFVRINLVGGALVASWPLLSLAKPALDSRGAGPSSDSAEFGYFVRIGPDNSVVIGAPTAEMGQGTFTSMPMLVAEELDADWDSTVVELMPLALRKLRDGEEGSDAAANGYDYAHAYQGGGGSHSVNRNYLYLRTAGAEVRDRLVRAAANQLGVSADELETESSFVIHRAGQVRIPYGELAAAAAMLEPSANVSLKNPSSFRIIGRQKRIKGSYDIVTGAPVFGIDQEMPGMVHAVLARCPYFQGEPLRVDAAVTKAMPGVIDVIEIKRQWPADGDSSNVLLCGSVAVIATSHWAALKGRNALEIEWDHGPFADESSESVEAEFFQFLNSEVPESAMRRSDGDVEAALKDSGKTFEADYEIKPLAHVCMEPHSAIADMRQGQWKVIAAHQFPELAAFTAAEITGCDPLDVQVETARMGGGFGRKYSTDYLSEAIWLSHKLQRPVKSTWSRDDDIRQDAFNRPGISRLQAGLDEQNKVVAWDHLVAGHGYHADSFPAGFVDNYRIRYLRSSTGMRFGPWRGPGHNTMGFVVESFIDEIAYAAGRDPLELRLEMLGDPRIIPFEGWGADFYDTGRAAAVLNMAAEKADWNKRDEMPEGQGRGIASHFTFGSYCAHVVDVSVQNGKLEVLRVVSAIDCGQPVNRLGIAAQIEGGATDGLSTALNQAIHVIDGMVVESNFDTYQLMRINAAPRQMETHIVESDAYPSGTGEVGLPPFIPALTNAIFAAAGIRIRKLPIADQLNNTNLNSEGVAA